MISFGYVQRTSFTDFNEQSLDFEGNQAVV